ncbi:uncharacterized protein [Littorina saxatilis]|uniref:uncharacterized protein n=1 Tax=Littorina saxatilis TaxID=31220 RepID=UPI0038B4EE9E
MAAETKGKILIVRLRSWLCVSTWFLAMAPSCFSFELSFRELYLNSYVFCGHGDAKELWKAVDRTSVYNVKDDVRSDIGTSPFRSCEMVFRSTRRDGRLCMMQKQLKFDSFDVQLEIFDGWMDVDGLSEPNKTLNHAQGLRSVEWCTSGRYLTIRVSENGQNPSMKDVEIDLMVYDMRSYHRKASMDSLPSCGSKFLMDGSQVNVTNLDPQRKVKDIFPECSLTFEYVGHKENRSLCLVFESSLAANPRCSKLNYTLNIISHYQHPETGKTRKVLSGIRTCGQPTPRQWCSNTTKISLELHRETKSGSTKTTEDAVMFYALVVDHNGGPETLPLLFDPPSESSSAHESLIVVVIVASVVFSIIIIAVIAVFLYRRHRSHSKQEEKPNKKEMQYNAPMLPASVGNGYSGNAYS